MTSGEPDDTLSFGERVHYYHRFWRYARRTEPDTVRFIREEVKPGDVALDIGANKGIVAWFLAKQTGEAGRVIAFEPQPEMVSQVERVTRAFRLPNVEVHGVGLSDRRDTARLYRGEAGSTANLVSGRDWQKEELEVDIVTLDSFVAENDIGRVNFIKCDVDGYEVPVLAGASGVLERDGPILLIEISEQDLDEVSAVLRERGYDEGVFWYRGRRYPAMDTARVAYRHESARFRNFLFRRKEGRSVPTSGAG